MWLLRITKEHLKTLTIRGRRVQTRSSNIDKNAKQTKNQNCWIISLSFLKSPCEMHSNVPSVCLIISEIVIKRIWWKSFVFFWVKRFPLKMSTFISPLLPNQQACLNSCECTSHGDSKDDNEILMLNNFVDVLNIFWSLSATASVLEIVRIE